MHAQTPAPSQAVPSERGMGYVGLSRTVPSGRTSGDDLHGGGRIGHGLRYFLLLAPRILQSLRGQKERAAQGTSVTPRARPWHHVPGQALWSGGPKPTKNCRARHTKLLAHGSLWVLLLGTREHGALLAQDKTSPSLAPSSPVKQELLLKSTQRFLTWEENSCPLLHLSGSWLTKPLQQLSTITGC